MYYKICVIGGAETVVGFKALGLEVFPVVNAEEARKVLRTVTDPEKGYAIIYIEETLAEKLQGEIAAFHDLPTPAIILIPGRDGSLGLGRQALQSAVERAVGSNIL